MLQKIKKINTTVISWWRRSTSRLNFKNIFYYIQGNTRQWCYDHCRFLLSNHIIEQYEYRLKQCPFCVQNGETLCCGCKTPNVFFCDKKCAFGKYPAMKDPFDWMIYKILQRFLK